MSGARLYRIRSKGIGAFDFDVTLDHRLVLIAGPNGSGKTSLIRAVQIGLWGYVPEMGKARTAALFRDGCEPEVHLHFAREGRADFILHRVMGNAGQRLNVQPSKGERTLAAGQARINDEIGMPVELVDIESFLEKTPAKRATAMASMLAGRITAITDVDAVVDALAARGIDRVAVHQTVSDAWEDGDDAFACLDRIERVFVAGAAAAQVASRAASETLQALYATAAPSIPQTSTDIDAEVDAVNDRLKDLYAERKVARERMATIRSVEDDLKVTQGRLAKARADRDDFALRAEQMWVAMDRGGALPNGQQAITEADIDALSRDVEARADRLTVDRMAPGGDPAPHEALWTQAMQRLSDAQARMAKVRAILHNPTLRAATALRASVARVANELGCIIDTRIDVDLLTRLNEIHLALNEAVRVCEQALGMDVIVSPEAEFEASELGVAAAEMDVIERRKELEAARADAAGRERAIVQKTQDLDAVRWQLKTGRAQRAEQVAHIERLTMQVAEATTEITELEQRVQATAERLAALPQPTALTDVDAEESGLRTRLAELRDLGRAKTSDLERRREIARLEDELQTKTGRASLMRGAAAAVRAIIGDAISQVTAPFTEAANGLMKQVGVAGPPPQIELLAANGGIDFAVMVGGRRLTWAALSSGQQALVICGIAAGLAALNGSGTKILFIDGSRIDLERMQWLMGSLQLATSNGIFDLALVEHCHTFKDHAMCAPEFVWVPSCSRDPEVVTKAV